MPPLVKLSDYGDWNAYQEALYRIYRVEVAEAKLSFRGLPVRLRFHPESAGKHYSFWHLISEGSKEDERIPDLRRCERLRWIAWTIREADRSDAVRCWENQRSGNSHVVLWLHNEHFAVVLAARNDYYLLKTAYVLAPNRERDFYREWQACGGKN